MIEVLLLFIFFALCGIGNDKDVADELKNIRQILMCDLPKTARADELLERLDKIDSPPESFRKFNKRIKRLLGGNK